jgi:hypothetical protein
MGAPPMGFAPWHCWQLVAITSSTPQNASELAIAGGCAGVLSGEIGSSGPPAPAAEAIGCGEPVTTAGWPATAVVLDCTVAGATGTVTWGVPELDSEGWAACEHAAPTTVNHTSAMRPDLMNAATLLLLMHKPIGRLPQPLCTQICVVT